MAAAGGNEPARRGGRGERGWLRDRAVYDRFDASVRSVTEEERTDVQAAQYSIIIPANMIGLMI